MNKGKIILDLCGGTGAWSKPYRDAGYDVHILTLPDIDICDYSVNNATGEISFKHKTKLIGGYDYKIKLKDVYGILAAPPCTMFSLA